MLEHIVVGPRGNGDPTWVATRMEGHGFHDCPYCRELGARPEALVGIDPRHFAELVELGWIQSLVELVGPDAPLELIGSDPDTDPTDGLTMGEFLDRVGYGY